ncbi:MAG: trypsin-like peptidase domain-containing protein [bacterium]|jgi:S1-C subfamily serine protease|nr:trypsin-like peptidase domain-containing protein [bacterium]
MSLITRLRAIGAACAAAVLLAGCAVSAKLPVVGEVGVRTGSDAGQAAKPQPSPGKVATTTSPTSLTDLQSQFTQIVQQATPSVVELQTPGQGEGSGVVLDGRGDIVTNAHVVEDFSTVTVRSSAGTQHQAQLLGSDSTQDLAVVRTDATPDLRPATFADSAQLKVGDIVLAIGSPYGLQSTVTEGVVSALGRSQQSDDREPGTRRTPSSPGTGQTPGSRCSSGGATLDGLVQTSAPINPGNSGGALVDLQGHVVGIPTLAAQGADGLGFAIPSSRVVNTADRLLRGR